MTKRIAIFASGTGTNALSLIEKAKKLTELVSTALVFTDNPQAPILHKLQELHPEIDTLILDPAKFSSKKIFEKELLKNLEAKNINGIFLAGYMRILSSSFLKSFQGDSFKVLNIHPSLLPNYPGLSAYQKAYLDRVRIHGATVHFVDEGMDTGPVILQIQYKANTQQSLEDFINHGKSWEWKLYQHVLAMWSMDRIQINKYGKRVLVECPPLNGV